MLIPFLVIICFAAAFFVLCGVAIGHSGRAALREQLAWALGELRQSNDKADKMTEIAGKALTVAHEKHFPQQTISPRQHSQLETQFQNYHADPDPFQVQNCPRCKVSVRATQWPQVCPNQNCKTSFGDELDADLIG